MRIVCACAAALSAQSIHLKSQRIDLSAGARAAAPGKRLSTGRSHVLLQYATRPGPDEIAEVMRRGGRVTGYVPDNALVVVAGDNADFSGLGLLSTGRLTALDKLSPWLPDSGEATVVAEFHDDVDVADARAIAAQVGVEIVERKGMRRGHLLVHGPIEQLRAIAEWDEAAYLFPASPELVRGDDVLACGGPITEAGLIGQYVTQGTGWTHSAGQRVDLKYVFGAISGPLSPATAQAEIARALQEWPKFGHLTFAPGTNSSDTRTLYIWFASADHGDGNPFDGPYGILAHAYYPSPPNPESIAGDMHLDAAENWTTAASGGINLFSVALHEAGHALGLAHSDQSGAVMYPYYHYVTGLAADDIAGIQALYGAAQIAPTPVSVTPSSGSGASQTFSFVTSDPSGYTSLQWVAMDIHSTLSNASACYLQYHRATNTLQLATDNGLAW
ncbi:MAG: matrixin family metalloprotease, partial [Bryobacteraceae bacterium]